jgi:hypothetical protein
MDVPGRGGIEAIRKIAQSLSETRVIVLTLLDARDWPIVLGC